MKLNSLNILLKMILYYLNILKIKLFKFILKHLNLLLKIKLYLLLKIISIYKKMNYLLNNIFFTYFFHVFKKYFCVHLILLIKQLFLLLIQ